MSAANAGVGVFTLPTWPEDDDLLPEEPMLRVVRGQADDDEIAALVTALAVATAMPPSPPPESTASPSEWARPLRTNAGAPAGRGGWRRSGLPAHRTW